jgi:hypothetical protein
MTLPQDPGDARGVLHIGLTALYHHQHGDIEAAMRFHGALLHHVKQQARTPSLPRDPDCRHSD